MWSFMSVLSAVPHKMLKSSVEIQIYVRLSIQAKVKQVRRGKRMQKACNRISRRKYLYNEGGKKSSLIDERLICLVNVPNEI